MEPKSYENKMNKKNSNSNSRSSIIFFSTLIVCVLLLIVKIVTGFVDIQKSKKIEKLSNIEVSVTVDETKNQKIIDDIESGKPDSSSTENIPTSTKLVDNVATVADSYIDPTTGMEFVSVKGGCYQMGDMYGDGRINEKPVHEVCVDDFYIGKYEVTQGEFEKIPGININYSRIGSDYPMEEVSWDDVQIYIKKLNSGSGKNYRLPTEAEWEYAARSGGKKEKYAGSNIIDDVAWYEGNYNYISHVVGTKQANGLGIHDMSGGVFEWCSDWYSDSYYDISPRLNPKGPSAGGARVLRSGNWFSIPKYARSSYRSKNNLSERSAGVGFRLVY